MDRNPHRQIPEAASEISGALVELEALPPGPAGASTSTALTLRADAARDVRDSLGAALVETSKAGRRAVQVQEMYRLVPSEQASKGLADGSLRWATARKGDASVLIQDSATGRIADHGQLQRVRPSPAKVLGPAVWEAMAMATQQHYLVEINEKLQSIHKGVSEMLSRLDGDKRGTLAQVRKVALNSRVHLDEGGALSDARVRELQDGVQRADEVWHQLHERMTRHLGEYQAGEQTPDEVEGSWAMLLYATQVLAETSAVLAALPYETVAQLEAATSEERERVLHAVERMRELAAELHDAHQHWATRNAEWHLQRTRNPARNAVRAVRKSAMSRPAQPPLDYATAWRASQLAAPPRPPAALLVSLNEDGTVDVATEPARDEVG